MAIFIPDVRDFRKVPERFKNLAGRIHVLSLTKQDTSLENIIAHAKEYPGFDGQSIPFRYAFPEFSIDIWVRLVNDSGQYDTFEFMQPPPDRFKTAEYDFSIDKAGRGVFCKEKEGRKKTNLPRIIRAIASENKAYLIGWPLFGDKVSRSLKKAFHARRNTLFVEPHKAVLSFARQENASVAYVLFVPLHSFRNGFAEVRHSEALDSLMRQVPLSRMVVVASPNHPDNYNLTFDECNEELNAPALNEQQAQLSPERHRKIFLSDLDQELSIISSPTIALPVLQEGYSRLSDVYVQLREAGRIFEKQKGLPELPSHLKQYFNNRGKYIDRVRRDCREIMRTMRTFPAEDRVECLEYFFNSIPEIPEYTFGNLKSSNYRQLLDCVRYVAAVRDEVKVFMAEAGHLWSPKLFRQRVKKVVQEDRTIDGSSSVNYDVKASTLPGSFGTGKK